MKNIIKLSLAITLSFLLCIGSERPDSSHDQNFWDEIKEQANRNLVATNVMSYVYREQPVPAHILRQADPDTVEFARRYNKRLQQQLQNQEPR